MEYKDENFIPRYLGKICLVNFIIFLRTIKIGILIGNYLLIYSHLHGNFIPTLLYPGIKFSKLVTNTDIYIPIILFSKINKYNLKQTHAYLSLCWLRFIVSLINFIWLLKKNPVFLLWVMTFFFSFPIYTFN